MIHTLANHSLASFALEFPRQKSGKGKSCQPDPDLLPSNPLWVQPWTWTVVLDGAVRHLAEASAMDRLSQHTEDATPCLAQGWCSQCPLLQPQLWTVKKSRAANTPGPSTLLHNMIPGWEVLYITYFFVTLHCLPSIQHQPTTERKLGWDTAQLSLHRSARTWSRQCSSYESKHRYFLTK